MYCFNPRTVYCRSATASYVDAWLTSWQWGIPITLRPPLPLSLFLAIHLTTLEDGRILTNFVEL